MPSRPSPSPSLGLLLVSPRAAALAAERRRCSLAARCHRPRKVSRRSLLPGCPRRRQQPERPRWRSRKCRRRRRHRRRRRGSASRPTSLLLLPLPLASAARPARARRQRATQQQPLPQCRTERAPTGRACRQRSAARAGVGAGRKGRRRQRVWRRAFSSATKTPPLPPPSSLSSSSSPPTSPLRLLRRAGPIGNRSVRQLHRLSLKLLRRQSPGRWARASSAAWS